MTNTLIVRTIPGLGDALSCTPGIEAYIKDNPDENVTVAFPKWILPVLQGTFKNIVPSETVLHNTYDKVLKLSDPCPAALYEVQHLQTTKKSRVQIFAEALGFAPIQFLGKRPIWTFSEEEVAYAQELRAQIPGGRIGIVAESSDKYRDYPHMIELVYELLEMKELRSFLIFVKSADRFPIDMSKCDGRVHIIADKTIRESVVYQSICDYIITPDTFFLHSAAALNIGTLLLEGPLANDVRFYGYPVLRMNARMDCIPCWRNTNIPCKHDTANLNNSVCMDKITPQFIKRTILEGMIS